MTDLTYTSKLVNFDAINKEVTLKLMIPLEDENNKYEFNNSYDLSKFRLVKKNINAIFLHLKKENDVDGTQLFATAYNHELNIKVSNLQNHVTDFDRTFDFELNESLVLVLHDNIFRPNDVNFLFSQIEDLYSKAKKEGNFSIQMPTINFVPRRLGVSIIKP